MTAKSLKDEPEISGVNTPWQNFLALVSGHRRLFLATPLVLWAIVQLAYVFGGKDIRAVIEFMTNK